MEKRVNKPVNFLQVYQELFEKFKSKQGRILELGIQSGGSLELWSKWLPGFQVIGVDILDSKQFDTDRIKTLHCEQRDKKIIEYAPFDIIIDDGGHKMSEQIGSFQLLFPHLNQGGLYIIEDLNTSYWHEFRDQPEPTTDFLMKLVDDVNREAFDEPRRCQIVKTRKFLEIESIHFYKFLCVIKKA